MLARKVISVFEPAFRDILERDGDVRRDILTKYVQLEPAVAANVVILKMSQVKGMDAGILQTYADMLFELGELKAKLDASNLLYRPE